MAAHDRDACLRASFRASREDRVEHIEGELIVGKEHEVEREPGLAAHRPHVRQRVGRSDRSEREWVVDQRRDDVGGEHEIACGRDLDDRRVVGELVIDDDVAADVSRAAMRQLAQNMCQLAEPELCGSTAAARILREAEGGFGFGCHRQRLRQDHAMCEVVCVRSKTK
jgi:hypothetical protein